MRSLNVAQVITCLTRSSDKFKDFVHVAKSLVQRLVCHALLEKISRRSGEEEAERRRREPITLLPGFPTRYVDRLVRFKEIEGRVDINQLLKNDLFALAALHLVISAEVAHDIRFFLSH